MKNEYDALIKNDIWELVPRPPYQKVIGYLWVHKTKTLANGDLDKRKSRLVAQGYL